MDIREIEQAAREQGWQVGRTSKGHLKFVPPDPVVMPAMDSVEELSTKI